MAVGPSARVGMDITTPDYIRRSVTGSSSIPSSSYSSYGPSSGPSGGGGGVQYLGSVGPSGPSFGGGGGGGSAFSMPSMPSYTAPILPSFGSSVDIHTSVNPLEDEAHNKWKAYESGLASGTNEEITRELQRARDEISVGMEREGEAAVGRGADAGFFRSRRLEQGKRDIHALQGKLADVALGRRAEALTGLTNAAGQAASGQRTLHLGTQAARLAENRLLLDQAEAQARLNEAPYRRMLDMFSTVGRFSSLLPTTGGMLG